MGVRASKANVGVGGKKEVSPPQLFRDWSGVTWCGVKDFVTLLPVCATVHISVVN